MTTEVTLAAELLAGNEPDGKRFEQYTIYFYLPRKESVTVNIECADDAPDSVKLGLAVRKAVQLGINLSWADLRWACLRGADLYRANLYGADLSGANLYRANLYGADLRGANLCRANLYGADLRGANLCRADLSGADLTGADLTGCIGS